MTSANNHILLASGYAAADQPGIHAFNFDSSQGTLTLLGSFTGIANPSFLAVHPNRHWLFAVSETSHTVDGLQGAVWAFRLEHDPFQFHLINQQSTKGDWPCHLRIDNTGKWLIASNYGSGNAALFPIEANGALGELKEFVQHEGQGPDASRQEGPHAHSATWTPDNQYVVIADLGIDQLVIYEFDTVLGTMKPHAVTHTQPGAGPRHMAIHANRKYVYVANELDNTVAVFGYDAENGTLGQLQTIETLPDEVPENTVADIHIAPSSQRLYVSNRGHNSIATFAIEADGRLSRLTISSCGGNWPRNFTLAPGGRFMLVANEHSDEISVLPILVGEEELGSAKVGAMVTRPSCLQFLPGSPPE